MKRIILLTSILVIVLTMGAVQKVSAQYYYYDNDTYDTPLTFEMGISGGAMNSLTDVGGGKAAAGNGIKNLYLGDGYTHPCGSVYLSGVYKYAYGLRLEATYGNVSAADSTIKNKTDGRYQRNLSFRSKINEVALIAEFYPLFMFIDWPSKDHDPPRISPYLLAGIGVFSFNPQARDSTGAWIDLQPLHTEGEGFSQYPGRKEYKLTQVNFPVGVGVKYEVTNKINVRAELEWRILQTDYLDDVSTRYIDPSTFSDYFPVGSQNWKEANSLYMRNKNNNIPISGLNSTPGDLADGHPNGSIRGDSNKNDTYFSFNIKVGIAFGRADR